MEDLRTRLETTESEAATARKLAEKGAGLLRKAEEEKDAIEAKAH